MPPLKSYPVNGYWVLAPGDKPLDTWRDVYGNLVSFRHGLQVIFPMQENTLDTHALIKRIAENHFIKGSPEYRVVLHALLVFKDRLDEFARVTKEPRNA